MKKIIVLVAGLLLVLLAVFFGLGPQSVESILNRVRASPSSRVSPQARALHGDLEIVDLHADSLLLARDLLERGSRGHADVPRLIAGNVALEVFTAVTKTPRGLNYDRNEANSDNIFWLALAQRWPPSTWNSLTARALYLAKRFDQTAASSNGKLVPIRTPQDLASYLKRRKEHREITAGLLGIEGAQALDGKIENLEPLFQAGYRYMSLTHFFDDEFAGSSAGVKKGGLTPLGHELVRQMNARGMIIDLAHSSPQTIRDVLAESKRPVIYSHGGLQGNCNNRRNLSDEEARGIARSGGIIGIGFWPMAVCGKDATAIARAIRYAVQIAGIEHVGLGSDFDGSVTVPFDAAHLSELTEALLQEGFSAADIRAVMGGNALRFFSENLPKQWIQLNSSLEFFSEALWAAASCVKYAQDFDGAGTNAIWKDIRCIRDH
jgi:membrane dipeptidase